MKSKILLLCIVSALSMTACSFQPADSVSTNYFPENETVAARNKETTEENYSVMIIQHSTGISTSLNVLLLDCRGIVNGNISNHLDDHLKIVEDAQTKCSDFINTLQSDKIPASKYEVNQQMIEAVRDLSIALDNYKNVITEEYDSISGDVLGDRFIDLADPTAIDPASKLASDRVTEAMDEVSLKYMYISQLTANI